LGGKGVEVFVFGDWSVHKGDRQILKKGEQLLEVLHTFVMVRGPVPRKVFFERLGLNEGDPTHKRRLSQHLYSLGKALDVKIHGKKSVFFDFSALTVDLWEFLDDMEEDPPRLEQARAILQKGGLHDPCSRTSRHQIWKEAVARYESAKKKLDEAAFAPDPPPALRSRVAAYVSQTRERLLDHKVVPGVIDDQKVGDVRGILDRIKAMRSGNDGDGGRLRAAVLADRLEGKVEGCPSRIVLIGGSGAGKEITAVMTCLELAERFERDPSSGLVPVYVDAMRRRLEPGFGGAEWFAKLLEEAGLEEGQKPIVVLTHADAYLASEDEIQAALAQDLFQVEHLLVCCGANFYGSRLRLRSFLDAEEEPLEPWKRDFQEDFAEATMEPTVVERFRRWLDGDESREALCEVPLHLVYVLTMLAESQELEEVSQPTDLLEAVAQVRLSLSLGDGFDVDDCLDLLGAVAHNFYRDAIISTGPPIQLSRGGLLALLENRKGSLEHPPRRWRDQLLHSTLLTAYGPQTFAFEHPIWGAYLVARHIDSTLRVRPEETLRVFCKFLSADVSVLCEELLESSATTDAESLRQALRSALDEGDPDLDPDRIRIAREQICYFLGTIKHRGMRTELLHRVNPASENHEPDPLIRRAILFGLADGGSYLAANRYVDRLRAEREAGETRERETNIGFHLTFRGDQPFVLGRPTVVTEGVSCARTVAALVRGLQERKHRGSWRIKLFTLLELANHPKVDLKVFDAEFEKNLDELTPALERLRRGRRSSSWPELEELRRLIEEFEKGKR
jgi:hypothetical protein